jgi:hypothetical protein
MIKKIIIICISLFCMNLYAQKIEHGQRFRALIIGIDGMKGVQFHQQVFLQKGAKNINFIAQHGQYATCTDVTDPNCAHTHLGARFSPDYSWVTSSGWASVITGMNVNKHLVKDNDFESQKIFYQTTRQFPTFFSQLKQKGFVTAAGGVAAFVSSINDYGSKAHVSAGILDYECGIDNNKKSSSVAADAIKSCNADYRQSANGHDPLRDELLTKWMVNLINKSGSQSPDVIMGVYDTVDGAGHDFGFSSNPGYLSAITRADNQIGQLVQAIQTRLKKSNDVWLVIITSDHGGHVNPDRSGGHGNVANDDEVVPFVSAVFGDNLYLEDTGAIDADNVTQMDTNPSILHWFNLPTNVTDGVVRSQYYWD